MSPGLIAAAACWYNYRRWLAGPRHGHARCFGTRYGRPIRGPLRVHPVQSGPHYF